jgi:antitoxin (DNA-binding transcriptional repressor) of toxin-antitoxin stability system
MFAWDVSVALGEPVAAIVPVRSQTNRQRLRNKIGRAIDALQSATREFHANYAPTLP